MRASIIGDSIVKYIDRGSEDIKVICKPGAYLEDVPALLYENGLLGENKCDLFLFHIGTNNLSSAGISINSCVHKMKELCRLVHASCPNAVVGVSGVLARKPSLLSCSAEADIAGINEKIEKYNEEIEKFCSTDGIHFIDNGSLNSCHLSKDGLHLNFSGSRALSEKLYRFVDKVHDDYTKSVAHVGLLTEEHYPPLPSVPTNVNKVEKSVACSKTVNKYGSWQQKYITAKSVGESNNFAEKLDSYKERFGNRNSCEKALKLGLKKPLLKNRKRPSLDQSIQKCVISEVQTSPNAITDSYFETSNRFQALFDDDSDDVNTSNEISDYVETDVCISEFSEVVSEKKPQKKKRSHQKKKKTNDQSCKNQQIRNTKSTYTVDKVDLTGLEKNVPASFSENFSTNGYLISVDISIVPLQPCNSIIFHSSRDTVSMHSIYSFVSQTTGVPARNIFFKKISGQYIDKHSSLSCTENQNIVMFFKLKGGGRGRKRKNEDYHPNKECGPCAICGKVSFRYFHLSDRQDDPSILKHFRTLAPSVLDTDCICKGCETGYRNRKTPKPDSYFKEESNILCHMSNYGLCQSEKKRAVIVNEVELVKLFNLPVASPQDINVSVMLCKDHSLMYFNVKNKCSICDKKLSSQKRQYSLPDTSADFVALYLSQIPGCEVNTRETKISDLSICGGCYCAVKKFMADNFKSQGGACSYEKRIESVKQIWSASSCMSNNPGLSHCIVSCCNAFLKHKPVLLTTVYDDFMKHASQSECTSSNQRWLLQKLVEIFGDALSFITDEYKRMGTMLKRADNDDNKALHDYLYNESLNKDSSSVSTSEILKDRLHSAAKLLRDRLCYDQKKRCKNFDGFDLENFDPCTFIQESCDPVLFDFISILQGESPNNFGEKVEFDKLNRKKALSNLNIICCILFSSDISCRVPLHLLFTDIIDKFTNSSWECLRILNQFGICYSKSFLNNYQESVIQRKKDIGVQLSAESFTVCSVDNINKRSSYAYVKSNDLSRGFDGTSVQVVEPMPLTIKWDKNEVCQPLTGSHTLKDKQGIFYKKVMTISDLSLFRSIATLCFTDLEAGKRDVNGMLQISDENEKETAVANAIYNYVDKIVPPVMTYLDAEDTSISLKEITEEYYQYLAISFLVGIPLKVFHTVKPNEIEILFQTKYQEMGKHKTSYLLNILKERTNESVHFYPILTSQTVFNENLLSYEFVENLNHVDTDEDLYSLGLFVKLAFSTGNVNFCSETDFIEEKSQDFVNQFSKLNLSFSSGRNLTTNEKLTNIPNDPYCFTDDPAEEMAAAAIDRKSFGYCIRKYIAESNLNEVTLPNLLQDLEFESVSDKEKSNVNFLYVMEENADNRETIKLALNKLYNDLGVHKKINYLVVVGDGKTYDHLVQLKNEFKDDLDWLLPYIGDWHVLKNYQLVLMKIYLDAGLKELVELFHQGILAKVVSQATGFDKTHNFLIQTWEALFRFELEIFFLSHDEKSFVNWNFDLETVCQMILDYSKVVKEDDFDFKEVSKKMSEFQCLVEGVNSEFYSFFDKLCSENKTWKFWHNFIHVDCLTYIKYYISLRMGDWNLRNHCVKHIAKLAQVTDSRYYCRLLPQNLVDMKRFPKYVIDHFKAGGFVLNVLGRNCHSQGLDEGHESCINKDVKAALNTCSSQSISKAVTYVPARANYLRKLKESLGITRSDKRTLSASLANSHEENVITLKASLAKSFLFAVYSEPELESQKDNLHHLFSVKFCDRKQTDSLCNILAEGIKHLNLYIEKCKNMKNYALCKQKPLKLTGMFSSRNTVSAVKRELRDVQSQNRMFRIQIAWSVENNVIMGDMRQYLSNSLPRAIATLDSMPYKSDKSKILQAYKSRYPEICASNFDISGFDSIILDGMFIIYSAPLRSFTTFSEYIQNLYMKYVSVYFDVGIKQVHIVFDDQNETCLTPKSVERSRRDNDSEKPGILPADFDQNSSLPRDWKKFLKVRGNKKNLVHLISEQFLYLGCCHLQPYQSLVLGGGFDESGIAKCVCNKQISECAEYFTNALEGDSRVWLHAFSNSGRKNLIYSPDNDIYHIGLPLLEQHPEKYIFVALDSQLESVLDMGKFSVSLKYDDKLGNSVPDILPTVQMLYVSTGCDYVSFFKDHGKKSFFDTFCKNANFISSGKEPYTGTLSQLDPDTNYGFLAFLRLVACEYFRKCAVEFKNNCPDMQIETLFKYLSKSQNTPLENHVLLINTIREALFKRCDEEHNIPTVEALHFHWLRSCWVCKTWAQADENGIIYPEIDQYGWRIEGSNVHFVWDTNENIQKAHNRLKLWTEGCNCKTACVTLRCGCKKSNNFCCPGCKCGSNCKNVAFTHDKQKSGTFCTLPEQEVRNSDSEPVDCSVLLENDNVVSSDETDEYSDNEEFFPDC